MMECNFFGEKFSDFCAPNCDRLQFLCDFFRERKIKTNIIEENEKKHLFVDFSANSQNLKSKKTLIAHYDRIPNSQGANDNSAAVWTIANWACKQIFGEKKNSAQKLNFEIIFTDGEELANGVFEQGAFSLAKKFKERFLKSEIYVFDACGRGETAILAQAGLSVLKKNDFGKRFAKLYEKTQRILKKICGKNWMSLPIPCSDNAGFLALGIPAIAITFLPIDEAVNYRAELLKNVQNAKIPQTWKLFHTEHDTIQTLTQKSAELLQKILCEIVKSENCL